MERKALIISLILATAHSRDYYTNRQPNFFDALPNLFSNMFTNHRNIFGNTYPPDNYNPRDTYLNTVNPKYQYNVGYQSRRPLQSNGFDNTNNYNGQFDSTPSNPSDTLDSSFTPNYNNEEVVTTPTSTEAARETLHLSSNPPNLHTSTKGTDFNEGTAHVSTSKRDINSLTNTNKVITNLQKPNNTNDVIQTNPNVHTHEEPPLTKENDSVTINSPRDPNAIVFPDTADKVKKEAQHNHKSTPEYPNKFNDTPQILYAVNIGPSETLWNRNGNTPLTNPTTQAPVRSNSQNFVISPGQASYATLETTQPPVTNKLVLANPLGNSIVLPNNNGGSTLYTIVNLPNSISDANVPSQSYQTVIANPSNYQTQTSVPTSNGEIVSGVPAYYIVNQPTQNLPYTSAPVKYTIGYISSNGQTVLVPSSPIVYQIIPQSFVPSTSVSNVQGNVITQPAQGNTITYLPVSSQGNTGQQTYVSVPNGQKNSLNYVPTNSQNQNYVVTDGQGNAGSQINVVPISSGQSGTQTYVPVTNDQSNGQSYVPISNGQGNTGSQVSVVPISDGQSNTQTYVPISNGQSNSQNYVPISNGQTSQISVVPVTNNQDNTYVPVSTDQGNVVGVSAPSETVVLPPGTETVTLLGFKDKTEEKEKKKSEKRKS